MDPQRLREARKKAGLSVEALAKAVSLSDTYIQNLERGITKKPSYHNVLKLAGALGVTDRFLMGSSDGTLDTAAPETDQLVDPALRDIEVRWHRLKDADPDAAQRMTIYINSLLDAEIRRDEEERERRARDHRSQAEPGGPDNPQVEPS